MQRYRIQITSFVSAESESEARATLDEVLDGQEGVEFKRGEPVAVSPEPETTPVSREFDAGASGC